MRTLLLPWFVAGLMLVGCSATSGGYFDPKFAHKKLERVGVAGFEGPTKVASSLADAFAIELFKRGRFEVFERHQLDRILEEQGLAGHLATTEESRAVLEKVAKIDGLFVGSVSTYGGAFGSTDVNLSIKLLDIESGAVIYACSAKSDHVVVMLGTMGEAMDVVVDAIVDDLLSRLPD